MPKIVDYPRASLRRALALAEAVDALGGCATDSAAEAVGMKPGGAFKALVAATVKYGLVESSRGQLRATQLFRNFKLAYSDDERRAIERQAVMNVPLFDRLLGRFNGSKVPSHLDRVLIREYDVPEELASRLAQYFGESASDAGLIDDSGVVKLPGLGDEIVTAHGETTRGADPRLPPPESSLGLAQSVSVDVFRVRLTGPGMDSSIELQTEDDLVILDAMLAKIRRSLRSE